MSGLVVRRMLDDQNHDDLVGGVDIGVGPWQDFVPDLGWTSYLRFRWVPHGLQIVGSLSGDIPANARARVGVLPVGYRPAVTQLLPGTVSAGVVFGFGEMDIWGDGQVYTWWSISGAGAGIGIAGVIALD